MSDLPTNKMRRRVTIAVFSVIILLTAYICVNLFNVSVVKSEYYRSKANNQQLDSFTITANRGTIYDSKGKVLAQSSTVWDVIINPGDIEKFDKSKKEEICKSLSEICNVDYNKLMEACSNTDLRYYTVKAKVDKETKDAISELRIKNKLATYSVYTVENSKREYPNETLAASVIGFVNYDGDGVLGVEAYYDEYLQGIDGKIVTARDANGKAMPYDYETRYEAQNGNSLYLTIDEVLQYSLEKNLELALSQHKAQNRACGIIMNAKTGAILAMATAPTFNLNSPGTLSDYLKAQYDEYETELRTDSTRTEDEIKELLET
ncbi:MAG: cell division protein FtsI, partial [Ruminiclostridium sp.]|nr:cell division protein FtsI [Ruminiclostridium sp.]